MPNQPLVQLLHTAFTVPTQNIEFEFAQPVKLGTGDIVLSKGGVEIARFTSSSQDVSIDTTNHRLTINPSQDFEYDINYTVSFTEDSILDAVTDVAVDIQDIYNFTPRVKPDNIAYSINRNTNSVLEITPYFYNDDLDPSLLLDASHADIRNGWYLNDTRIVAELLLRAIHISAPNQVNAPDLSQDIVLEFDRDINLPTSHIKLAMMGSANQIQASVSIDSENPKQLIIKPAAPLAADEDYQILIDTTSIYEHSDIIYEFTTKNSTSDFSQYPGYVFRYYYGSGSNDYIEGQKYSHNAILINENAPNLGFSESVHPLLILDGSEDAAPYPIANIANTDNFKVKIQSGQFQVTGGIYADEVDFSALSKGISLVEYDDNDSVFMSSHYRIEALDGVAADSASGGTGEDFYTANQIGEIFSVENIVGTKYSDDIHFDGNNDEHIINALDGDNSIITFSGNDTVFALDGNDYISVGDGSALIHAGGGINTIRAKSGEHFDITTGVSSDDILIENSTSLIDFEGQNNTRLNIGTFAGNLQEYSLVASETRVGLNRLSFDYSAYSAMIGAATSSNSAENPPPNTTSKHDRLIVKVVSNNDVLAYKELLPAMLGSDSGHESISFSVNSEYEQEDLTVTFTAYDVQLRSGVATVSNILLQQEFEENIINAGDGNNVITLGDGLFTARSGSGSDTYTIGVGDSTIDVGSGAANVINSELNNGNQTFALKLSARMQSEENIPLPSSLTINEYDISASNSVLAINQARKDIIQLNFDQPINFSSQTDWRYVLFKDGADWTIKVEYSNDGGKNFDEAGSVKFEWKVDPLLGKNSYTLALLDPLLIKDSEQNQIIGVETGLRYQPINEIIDSDPRLAIVGGNQNDYILSATHLFSKESISASAFIEAGALGGDVYSFRIQQLDDGIPFVSSLSETLDLGIKKIIDSGNSGFLTQQDTIYIEGIRGFADMDFSRVKMVNEGVKSLEISYEQFPNFDPESIAASKGKIQVFGEFNPSTPQYHIEKLQFSPATNDDSNVFLDSLQTYYFGIDKLSISPSGFKSVVSNTMNHVANSILVGQESNVLSEKFQINLDGDGFDSEKEIRFYGLDDGKDFIKFNSVNDSINEITIYNNIYDYVAKKYAARLDEYLITNTTKNFDDFIQDENLDLHDYYNNITDTDWLDQDVSNRVLVDIEFQNVGQQFLTLILDGESGELMPESNDPLLFKYYLS